MLKGMKRQGASGPDLDTANIQELSDQEFKLTEINMLRALKVDHKQEQMGISREIKTLRNVRNQITEANEECF